MTNTTINKIFFLKASRKKVWEFLTNKDKMGEWFFTANEDLVENQEYELFEIEEDGNRIKRCWGKVLEMDKPSKLVYTFTIAPLNGNMTTVTWKLEQVLGSTRVTLTHEGIDKAAGDAASALLMALDAGWDRHIAKMREAVS